MILLWGFGLPSSSVLVPYYFSTSMLLDLSSFSPSFLVLPLCAVCSQQWAVRVYSLLHGHIYWLSMSNHLSLTMQHQTMSILQKLLSFQEQRQSCLVSLGTDTDIRFQEWQSHPNKRTICLFQARDRWVSHMKCDFLKDSDSKRSLKHWTGKLLLFICGTLSNEKESRAVLCPKTTFPFCSHTSQSLLQGLELLWSPSVLALSFHLPSSRYFFASCQGLVWKGSQDWSREERGQRYQQ